MRYGLLCYDTLNLGDEIQSLAALPFLPRVDVLLDRDNLSSYSFAEPTMVILNGWFSHHPENWPPDEERLRPLMISMHLSEMYGSSVEHMLTPAGVAYFKRWGPVGCRDLATVGYLQAKGIKAYFSGCLTLTFSRDRLVGKDAPRGSEVLAVDVPIEEAPKEAILLTHRVRDPRNSIERFFLARKLLERYARARYVITSRLHCALPCLALGTPVRFTPSSWEDPRFTGLSSLFEGSLGNIRLLAEFRAKLLDEMKLALSRI